MYPQGASHILDDTREIACKPFWIYSDILGLRDLLAKMAELSLNNDDFIIGVVPQGQASRSQLEHLVKTFMSILLMQIIKSYF
ncbi:MAG: hypothetical protein J7K14_08090 [Sulfurimonas sp.]|nr:hypothetical protein [Sulfurimonas sp.]